MSYLTVDATGAQAATFAEILDDLKSEYRLIYGADTYLENDSQDGQFLAIVARAISDTASAGIAIYNSFSPATAVGDALSRNVAINGIDRAVASNSAVSLVLIGVAGTTITNGAVGDSAGNRWVLPTSVVIGLGGTATATATCDKIGAIIAQPNTVTQILTPTRGWQSVSNPSSATLGNPVETDLMLRQRQRTSVALPSRGLLDGIVGAIAALDGVTDYKGYENDTNVVNALGLPPNCIAIVAAGGDPNQIAEAIQAKKSLGCATAGTTAVTVTDSASNPAIIRYYTADALPVITAITVQALAGYSDAVGVLIKQSVVDLINSAGIGGRITATKLAIAGGLAGRAESATYELLSITVNGASELTPSFIQLPTAVVGDVTIGVV